MTSKTKRNNKTKRTRKTAGRRKTIRGGALDWFSQLFSTSPETKIKGLEKKRTDLDTSCNSERETLKKKHETELNALNTKCESGKKKINDELSAVSATPVETPNPIQTPVTSESTSEERRLAETQIVGGKKKTKNVKK